MDAVERRALVLLIPIALLFALGFPGVPFQSPKAWEVVVYIGSTVCLAAAAVLVFVIIAPVGVVNLVAAQRERLYVLACGLLVANVVAVGVLRSWATYEAYKHL